MNYPEFNFEFSDRTPHFLFVKCTVCGEILSKCHMWESEYDFLRKLENHQLRVHSHHGLRELDDYKKAANDADFMGSTIGARVGRGELKRSNTHFVRREPVREQRVANQQLEESAYQDILVTEQLSQSQSNSA